MATKKAQDAIRVIRPKVVMRISTTIADVNGTLLLTETGLWYLNGICEIKISVERAVTVADPGEIRWWMKVNYGK